MELDTPSDTIMIRADKTLAALRANPRDWRITDLENVARAFEINIRKSTGSHVIFEHESVEDAISVPAHRPIKPIYVKAFVRLVDAVLTARQERESD